MTKFYLAYGSNLNVRQMRFRYPNAQPIGTAEISGYQLLFKGSKTGAYLTIEKKKGGIVPVAVWAVSPRDKITLDAYEGFPDFYYKAQMTLPVKSLKVGKTKLLTAFLYIMHEERNLGIPRHDYVQTCIEGYHHFGFDLRHLRQAMGISEKGVRCCAKQ